MFNIKLTNQKLKNLLSTVIDYSQKEEVIEYVNKLKEPIDPKFPDLHPASDEYLKEIMNLNISDYGYPKATYGLGMSMNQITLDNYKILEPLTNLSDKIGRFFGTPYNAVGLLYPANGFISWHHNGNAPGYNIIMSYSTDGEGSFDYWDYEKKEIVCLKDQPGWTIKVGRFPSINGEKYRVFWHRARTKNPRITIAYVINQKDMWVDMIREITDGDFDQRILNHN